MNKRGWFLSQHIFSFFVNHRLIEETLGRTYFIDDLNINFLYRKDPFVQFFLGPENFVSSWSQKESKKNFI